MMKCRSLQHMYIFIFIFFFCSADILLQYRKWEISCFVNGFVSPQTHIPRISSDRGSNSSTDFAVV